ncbi:MAG TPA: FKBP-type peptidyl-prolyl cis-trans isomerase [Polyangia bacterium]|nr:FKBP-type peptidyl-prolyl cis-trans isomerase [Polyangia bacterium]
MATGLAGPSGPASAAPPPAPPDVAAPPPSAQKTPSGQPTRLVVPGTGSKHPAGNDCVRLRYVSWNRQGGLAGTSSNDDEGEVECLHRMLPAIAEATAMMVVGETRRLWIPKALAFPPDDDDPPPARASDLTYDLTLLAIIPAPPTPRSLKAPPARARKLRSGVAIEILQKGTGAVHPAAGQQLSLHLSGWTTDGTMFQSTTMAGNQSTEFTLAELLPGLREGVQQMVVGQRARMWIPAALAYGEKPRRRAQPAGNLVFEVELVGMR